MGSIYRGLSGPGTEMWVRALSSDRAALTVAGATNAVRVQRWIPTQAGTEGYWSSVFAPWGNDAAVRALRSG